MRCRYYSKGSYQDFDYLGQKDGKVYIRDDNGRTYVSEISEVKHRLYILKKKESETVEDPYYLTGYNNSKEQYTHEEQSAAASTPEYNKLDGSPHAEGTPRMRYRY